jgi:glycosyltransferase involved in cell wall biosynthesis
LKFSIVVPSFNQAQFLRDTLDSIINGQRSVELQCIVQDGGSTDESIAVLRSFDPIALAAGVELEWRSEKDNGQADAINRGLQRATGDVVAYLNSDDCYEPGALKRVAEALDAHPDAAWVTGDCRIIDIAGTEIQRGVRAYRRFWLRRYSRARLLMLNFIAQPATFWRRSALVQSGLFDEQLHYALDYDYWLRLSAASAPVIIDEVLAEFRIHGESKGGRRFDRQFEEDYRTACRYTTNQWIRGFHRLHNAAIVLAYRFLK